MNNNSNIRIDSSLGLVMSSIGVKSMCKKSFCKKCKKPIENNLMYCDNCELDIEINQKEIDLEM